MIEVQAVIGDAIFFHPQPPFVMMIYHDLSPSFILSLSIFHQNSETLHLSWGTPWPMSAAKPRMVLPAGFPGMFCKCVCNSKAVDESTTQKNQEDK